MRAAAPRLAFFYAAIFLAMGVQLPFWPVWLTARGLTAGEIGVALAVGQWIKVAGNPLIGILADRSGERRRLMVALGALCLAAYALCLPASGFAVLLPLNTLIALCGAALLPLGDTITLAGTVEGSVDYGKVRLWGTGAFVLATLLGGALLAGRGPDIVLYLLLAATAFSTASCTLLPAPRMPTTASRIGGWRLLLTRRHVVFLAAATLVQASHAVYYAFGTLYWQHLGFSSNVIAWLWAESMIGEIALFSCGARIVARWGPLPLIALGGVAGSLRWSITAASASLPVLALVQLLHAFTFAAAHLGAMHHLARHVPAAQAVTGQALYSAAVNGLGFGLVTLGAGALYEVSGGLAYLAMAGLALAGGILAALLARRG